jgi:alpha-beta hydrolase superfamily lysophospholipase
MRLFRTLGIVVLGLVAVACGGADESTDPDVESGEADLVGFSTKCSDLSSVPGMTIERADADDGHVHLRIGIMAPQGEPKGDVLFLHGFSDRFDNHLPLFEGWRRAGMRVIAFDYPSHGETCGRGLDRYRINGIAKLASFVEKHTRPANDARPFLLAGWSTGGLVSVRMLQSSGIALERPVAGAFLLAPGVDVRFLVGDKQIVTQETLTHDPNPPHRGPISPKSPLQTPLFAADLTLNAGHARKDAYPTKVPTFVVTGGEEEDVYADTKGVVAWVEARQKEGARVYGLGCKDGRHELDNEAAPMGPDVQKSGVEFASWVVGGAAGEPPKSTSTVCTPY